MKKTALLLASLALLGAGCAPLASTPKAPTPPSTPKVETPASEPGHPPVVVMTVGDEAYPGVEGSFCYGGVCVDKIAPPALVAEARLESKAVARGSDAFFAVGGTVFEFGVTMTDASGTDLGLRIPTSFRGGKYTVKIPNATGNTLLMANVRFGQSGGDDVQYIFPINIR